MFESMGFLTMAPEQLKMTYVRDPEVVRAFLHSIEHVQPTMVRGLLLNLERKIKDDEYFNIPFADRRHYCRLGDSFLHYWHPGPGSSVYGFFNREVVAYCHEVQTPEEFFFHRAQHYLNADGREKWDNLVVFETPGQTLSERTKDHMRRTLLEMARQSSDGYLFFGRIPNEHNTLIEFNTQGAR